MTAISTLMVIGIGNPYRGDDGVGVYIARRLRERWGDALTILESDGELLTLLEHWEQTQKLVVFDAIYSNAPIGTVHRLDVHRDEIPATFFHCSTHSFGLAEAVQFARTLDQLPENFIIYGIEGASYTFGAELSAAVRAAADRLIEEFCLQYAPVLINGGAAR